MDTHIHTNNNNNNNNNNIYEYVELVNCGPIPLFDF
jgi:hypothetical protein